MVDYLKNHENTTPVYHGISNSQRGGLNTLETLKSILESGTIYPRGETPDGPENLHLAVFRHYLRKKGIQDSALKNKIDLEKYLGEPSNLNEILKECISPSEAKEIQSWIKSPEYKSALKNFGFDKVDISNLTRVGGTWYSKDEGEAQENYGREIYLQINAPENQIVEGVSEGIIVGPLSTKYLSKISLGQKLYNKYVGEIRQLLDKKGLKHVEIVSHESFPKRNLEGRILTYLILFFAIFSLIPVLPITGNFFREAFPPNSRNFVLPVVIILNFILIAFVLKKNIKNKRFRDI